MEQQLKYDYYVPWHASRPMFIGKEDEKVATYMSLNGAVLGHECRRVPGMSPDKRAVVIEPGDSFEAQVYSIDAYDLKYPNGPKPGPEVVMKFFKCHSIHKMQQTAKEQVKIIDEFHFAAKASAKASAKNDYDIKVANLDKMNTARHAILNTVFDEAIKSLNEAAAECAVVD